MIRLDFVDVFFHIVVGSCCVGLSLIQWPEAVLDIDETGLYQPVHVKLFLQHFPQSNEEDIVVLYRQFTDKDVVTQRRQYVPCFCAWHVVKEVVVESVVSGKTRVLYVIVIDIFFDLYGSVLCSNIHPICGGPLEQLPAAGVSLCHFGHGALCHIEVIQLIVVSDLIAYDCVVIVTFVIPINQSIVIVRLESLHLGPGEFRAIPLVYRPEAIAVFFVGLDQIVDRATEFGGVHES